MLLDYDALFAPYTADGHTVEAMVTWLRKQAVQRGLSPELADVAVQRTMMDLAEGKSFDQKKCRCGCGIDKAATDLIHYTFATMLALDQVAKIEMKKILEGDMNARILSHISAQNQQYIEQNTKAAPSLLDWSKSPVLNGLKRLRSK